jgi:hypothetical protein
MFLKRSRYEASLADVTSGLADVTGTDSMSVTPTLSCTPRRSVDGLTTGSTVPRVSFKRVGRLYKSNSYALKLNLHYNNFMALKTRK